MKDELCVGAVEGQLLVLVGSPIEGEWVVAQVDPALLNVQEHQSYLWFSEMLLLAVVAFCVSLCPKPLLWHDYDEIEGLLPFLPHPSNWSWKDVRTKTD